MDRAEFGFDHLREINIKIPGGCNHYSELPADVVEVMGAGDGDLNEALHQIIPESVKSRRGHHLESDESVRICANLLGIPDNQLGGRFADHHGVHAWYGRP